MIVNLRRYPRVWEQIIQYWLANATKVQKRSSITYGALSYLGIEANLIPADEFGCVHMTEEQFVWFSLKWS